MRAQLTHTGAATPVQRVRRIGASRRLPSQFHRPVAPLGRTPLRIARPLSSGSSMVAGALAVSCAVSELAPPAERTANRGKDRVVPQLKPGDKLHGFTVRPPQPRWWRTAGDDVQRREGSQPAYSSRSFVGHGHMTICGGGGGVRTAFSNTRSNRYAEWWAALAHPVTDERRTVLVCRSGGAPLTLGW